jgi:hypothetical protein
MFIALAAGNRLHNQLPRPRGESCFRRRSYFWLIRFLRNLAIIHLFRFALNSGADA